MRKIVRLQNKLLFVKVHLIGHSPHQPGSACWNNKLGIGSRDINGVFIASDLSVRVRKHNYLMTGEKVFALLIIVEKLQLEV